ncbi:glucan biosynthesis protein D [Lampropedia cohaerens]|uniref:Glucan biosynthesis protein D n=1 Tax=Lampropedia cohaerens TaxID=1610491 RepID=A0A0U1Q385_9BURK|nr:glucan biosynthesis protein D [Lampropedia cohaerens]
MSLERLLFPGLLAVAMASVSHAEAQFTVDGPFTADTVENLARELAAKPYSAPAPVPESLDKLTYDQYRAIRYRPERAIWADQPLPYRMQMFVSGFYYKEPVEIATVADGRAKHVRYAPDLFSVEPPAQVSLPAEDIGFSGLRLHNQLNRSGVWDELLVFQGASYFRALGRNQVYGMSARGLAIGTGSPAGEEFPLFRAFWVERPRAQTDLIKVHALLDSPSVAGAYTFIVRPGDNTVMDVQATLFPRVKITEVGLAPGTSMYFFGANDRIGVDDFRPSVHDSDGLLMINGRGERLWRPLANPQNLQISAFMDESPWGFGLMQRNRHYHNYQDLEAHYERRPSLWVEPQGDWGSGSVVLVEIPTQSEIHDNIVAFWRPSEPLAAGQTYRFAYRLNWGTGPQTRPGELHVAATRVGRASISEPTPRRLFVIDYEVPIEGTALPDELPTAQVSASVGTISNVVVRRNPQTHAYRVSFELDPASEKLIELRVDLNVADGRPAESWVYRWTP